MSLPPSDRAQLAFHITAKPIRLHVFTGVDVPVDTTEVDCLINLKIEDVANVINVINKVNPFSTLRNFNVDNILAAAEGFIKGITEGLTEGLTEDDLNWGYFRKEWSTSKTNFTPFAGELKLSTECDLSQGWWSPLPSVIVLHYVNGGGFIDEANQTMRLGKPNAR